ncbi:hypothetical protein GE061_011443 [Apolygus lucorum]|uniref:Uncharacterized protein n=1 Tax=Apolygus lucorum TaxID=248454 RepID=A0A8S9XZH2_APOLU|nr:hypothetical protein GE061_011443 [Apolygus lucorum]
MERRASVNSFHSSLSCDNFFISSGSRLLWEFQFQIIPVLAEARLVRWEDILGVSPLVDAMRYIAIILPHFVRDEFS